jgi:hypothetical protein
VAALKQDQFFNSYVDHAELASKPRTIFFNQANRALSDSLLGFGWSIPEKNFTWSDGSKATIRIPLPFDLGSGKLILEVFPFVNPIHKTQDVELYINGVKVNTVLFSESRAYILDIPLSKNLSSLSFLERITSLPVNIKFVTVEFRFKNAMKPTLIGLGEDDRDLGLALISASFKN